MFHQTITNRFLNKLEAIDHGAISITTPDGKRRDFAGAKAGPVVALTLHDWRAVTLFAMKADIGLAESYRDGWWEVDDLVGLLTFGLQNQSALASYVNGNGAAHLLSRLLYLFNRNSERGSRRNIHAHYDIGNAFYKLWLDPTMSYSAALDVREGEALATAQQRKYDRIVDCLGEPKGNLLEIGCGWGGFLARAAETSTAKLEGITISTAQEAYARARLNDRAAVALKDYRRQEGRYDHIVSIEMFEAVGERYWRLYFEKLRALLNPKGKAVIQTITVEEPAFELYRKSGDMIRTFIFPGGMLPSANRFEEEARRAGFMTGPRFEFGEDYARTVEVWQRNFEAALPEVRALGFDQKFIQIWRFYLASCIALFRHGRTNVMQMELVHAS